MGKDLTADCLNLDYLNNTPSMLWQSFKQGDNKALENIYLQHFDLLYLYGRQFSLDDPSLVEDCIQDLFLQLFKKTDKSNLSDTNSVKYYLMKSLRRSILHVKKANAKKQTKLVDDITDEASAGLFMNNCFPEESFQKTVLKKYLHRLPARQKEAIYLRFFSELDFLLIAQKMNLNIKSVYKVIYKGLKNLRRMYEIQNCPSVMEV